MLYLGVYSVIAVGNRNPPEQIRWGIRNTESGVDVKIMKVGFRKEWRGLVQMKRDGPHHGTVLERLKVVSYLTAVIKRRARRLQEASLNQLWECSVRASPPRCNKSAVITLQERGDGSELWEKSASRSIHSQEFISQTFESLHVCGHLWMAPAGWYTTRQKFERERFMNDLRHLQQVLSNFFASKPHIVFINIEMPHSQKNQLQYFCIT